MAGNFEESKYWRKGHYAIGPREIVFDLDQSPLPFLDWALVEAGQLAWVGQDGQKLPLDGDGSTPINQIHAEFVGSPRGIRIRRQAASKGPTLGTVVAPTYPWENETLHANTLLEDGGLYRLWYECEGGFAYAESEDLIQWRKPLSSAKSYQGHAKTNLTNLPMVEGSIFVDPTAQPEERFKAMFTSRVKRPQFEEIVRSTGKPVSAAANFKKTMLVRGATSADGLDWKIIDEALMLHFADTQTVPHFDPSIGRYVVFTRIFEMGRRSIGRSETSDFRNWPLPVTVIGPGPEDPPYTDFYLNACAFYPGQPTLRVIFCLAFNRLVENSEIRLASSRDGRLWHWTPGGPVLETGQPGEWDAGFMGVQSSFVRTRDGRMAVLYTGYNLPHKFPRKNNVKSNSAFAYWKEDRLAALEAPDHGEFTTYPVRLRGTGLMLNAETQRGGEIRVQVYDDRFRLIEGMSFAECDPIFGDHLAVPVTWRGPGDLSRYRDQVIHLRFRMRGARLFAIKAL